MQEWFQNLFAATLGLGDLGITVGLVVSVIVKIVIILIPLILTVAYLTYFERKVIGFMQLRVGPNVTGPWGLIQPFADVFKLLFKEVTRPKLSNKALFYIGPIMSLAPSFAAWAVIPFNEEWVLTNINIGLLYILMITSLSVYGVIIAGWASNSKYSFLGAMRASAQSISYEIAMSAALVCVVMVSGSMNFSDIVAAQAKGIAGGSVFSWNWLPLFPIFIVYLISAVAETNRAPFDVAEGESEIVAGHHVEYSGFAFALFFLAEYIFRILDVRENGGGSVLVPVDPCNFPALPLRPNHAFGLESADSDRLRLHRDFGRVDDFTAESVEIGQGGRLKVFR